VDIQRTDGRIHQAVVTGLAPETSSVTVEWYEKGETKGKEVELEMIQLLNPELFNNIANNANGVTSGATNGVKSPADEAQPAASPVEPTPRQQQPPREIPRPSGQGVFKAPAPRGGAPTRQARAVAAAAAAPPSQQKRQTRQTNILPPPPPQPTVTHDDDDDEEEEEEEETDDGGGDVPNGYGNSRVSMLKNQSTTAPRRKSECVKAVEKMEKEREERRTKLQDMKKKQEANVDKTRPNWEFLEMIEEFRSNLEYEPISNSDPIIDHQINVCVRKRPINKKELAKREIDVVTIGSKDTCIVHEPMKKVDLTKYLENQKFRFDYAFDESATNEVVYKYSARPLVTSIFEGGMATCFAYGQTGSGKTHTMGGAFTGKTQDCSQGIYALSARDVFKLLASPKYRKENLTVYASYFEIYSGKVFDLLNKKKKLSVLEDGKNQIQVVGLSEELVQNVDDVLHLIATGNNVRTSGTTSANQCSSRSHAIFQIVLKKKVSPTSTKEKLHGKFSLIDLAGNERGKDTGNSASRQIRMEGAEINKSLLALKECIRALGRKGAHLPFRASKLTLVLRDSFIGEKSRTCMIAMISPSMSSCEHTLNTLRYADRVKELGVDDPRKQGQVMESTDLDGSEYGTNNDNDLTLLASTNQTEMSEPFAVTPEESTDDEFRKEILHFHETLSHVQQLEEEVVDEHRNFIEMLEKNMEESRKIYDLSNSVDFDSEEYANRLQISLNEMTNHQSVLLEKLERLRKELCAEEQISRNITQSHHLARPPSSHTIGSGDHHYSGPGRRK